MNDQLDTHIGQFVMWYVNHRRRSTGRSPSPATERNKATLIRAVARALEELFPENVPPLHAAVSDESVFLRVLTHFESQWTTGSVRNLMYAMRDYGAFCVGLGLAKQNLPAGTQLPPKNPMPSISTYTEDEMTRFCAASWARGVRWGAFINTLAHTGRRVGELLGLEWDWFRLHDSPPHIGLPHTKNGNQDYIVLNSFLVEGVWSPANILTMREEVRHGRAAYHRSPKKYPFPWEYGTVYNRFRFFCRQLGIESRGFHNFRHTVITNRLASGMPIQAVAALAGHANVQQTSTRYNHATALSYAGLLD
jgi:integrase